MLHTYFLLRDLVSVASRVDFLVVMTYSVVTHTQIKNQNHLEVSEKVSPQLTGTIVSTF